MRFSEPIMTVLGELCDHPEYGYTTSALTTGDGPRFLRTTDISNGKIDWATVPYCLQQPEREDKYLLKDGDILISRAGSVGASVVITNPPRAIFASYLIRFRPRAKVLPKYLGYYLRSPYFFTLLKRQSSGTTLAGVNASNLSRIPIPVRPLKEQHSIITILEKAEAALAKRRKALVLADEFLKSTFLDIFGDPITNPRGWPVREFGANFESIRYGTGAPPKYQETGIPFIRATNVKKGTISPEGMVFIAPEDAAIIEKCKVGVGDLIIVRSGVNAGDCGLVSRRYDGAYAAYDLIVQLSYSRSVFYCHLLNSDFGQTLLAPLTRRAGQPHLNADQIRNLRLYCPPEEKLVQFASLLDKVDMLKTRQRASEQDLLNLFESLLARSFNKEADDDRGV